MRTLIQSFESKFRQLNERSADLIKTIDPVELFRKPPRFENTMVIFSTGEFVLRSAGALEQVFAGIMTRLWDDPFEWTLPEYMGTPERILDYLDEVGETTARGFQFLATDDDLLRCLPAPRDITPIVEILLGAYECAARFQGQAHAVARLLSERGGLPDTDPLQINT